MYRAFIVFHRWLALVVSIVLVVVALSGSVLVLESPLSRVYATHVEPGGVALSLDTLAARARAASGGTSVMMVGLGETPDLAWDVVLAVPGGRQGVTLNPYTGAIVPETNDTPALVSFVRTVHQLHTRLLAGRVGSTVVAVVTIAAVFLVLTGLVIWWREKLWRVSTTASWKRINFDLHHSLGVFSAIVLLLITATGVWVHFDDIDLLMRKMDRAPAPTAPLQPAANPGETLLPLDAIARAARASIPGAAIMNIQLPKPDAPAMVQMKYPEDHTPAGRSRVWIDRYRATALLVSSTRTAEPGQHLINMKRALHTGDIYGAPTQVIWALACLVLVAQAVTGVLMWWNARKARGVR